MNEYEIFDGKTVGDLFKDIYRNHERQKVEISTITKELAKHIQVIEDAVALGPVVQTMLDTGVKNDEQLIKLANVVQRFVSADNKGKSSEEDMFGLTEAEKEKLLKAAAEDIAREMHEIEDSVNDLKSKL